MLLPARKIFCPVVTMSLDHIGPINVPYGALLLAALLVSEYGCSRPQVEETYWPDGSLKERFSVSTTDDGEIVKDGPYKSWNQEGRILAEGHYQNELRHGEWTLWYGTDPNVKRQEGTYVLDTKDGEWRVWMNPAHAHAAKTESRDQDHTHHTPGEGVSEQNKIWHHPPHHKVENYKAGVPHGFWLSWHPSEHIADSVYYENGKLEGKMISYHSNGQVATVAEFRHGVLQGKQIIWDPEGKVVTEID